MWLPLIARAVNENGVHDIRDPWPAKDIVYTSIVGVIMVAALLEWFLWLSAFLYCLVKVFQKAEGKEKITVRILATIIMILFTAFRAIFLPIMVVTLPLPSQVTQYFPKEMVSFLQWFAFWSFAGLLTIPWLFCVYQVVTHDIGRTNRVKHVLDKDSAPKVVIIMPCYKEKPDVLLTTVNSIVNCEYPPSCMHLFISFDGDGKDKDGNPTPDSKEDEAMYLGTIEALGVPIVLDTYPVSLDLIYRNCRITISRFPHGGKRKAQKKTFYLIDAIYKDYLKESDNLFVLFIDSDCILDKFCIQNFMYEMEIKPGSKKNMLAMTGVITSTTEKNSLITLLQDMEYVHGQLFERCVESGCGAVTCLPGALTVLRFNAFRRLAKFYFSDKAELCEDLFDFGKCHLGEDRWLTHLFMIHAEERYLIQMNTGAFCKTEAVQTYKDLLKQRRRWFLGFITNEVCMLTDVRLWKKYPILCVIRFAQNTIRTTALLFLVMVLSLATTSQRISNLPIGFIGVSLGLNWILMLYFGAKLGRYKVMLYPLMFVVNPFFNWVYMVYGIFTAGQRTWGGPRADAAVANATTTPQQAIDNAMKAGDDLQVVPETFKHATQAGWHQAGDDDDSVNLPLGAMPGRTLTLHPAVRRSSMESDTSDMSHIYLPVRVEDKLSASQIAEYQHFQDGQELPGGADFESPSVLDLSNYRKGHGFVSPQAPYAQSSTARPSPLANSHILGGEKDHDDRGSPSPESDGIEMAHTGQNKKLQKKR